MVLRPQEQKKVEKMKIKDSCSGTEPAPDKLLEKTKSEGSDILMLNSEEKTNNISQKKQAVKSSTARSMTDQEYEELFRSVLLRPEIECAEEPIVTNGQNLDKIEEGCHTSENDGNGNTIETRAETLPECSAQSQGQVPDIGLNNIVDSATFLQQTNEITPAVSDDEVISNGKHRDLECKYPEPSKKSKKLGYIADRTKKTKRVSAKHLDFASKEVMVPETLANNRDGVVEKSPEHFEKQDIEEKWSSMDLIEHGTWVQCCSSECQKWRYLKEMQDPSEIPSVWLCSMNTDEKYNNCEIPEEDYDEETHIFTNYAEGSVVWARMTGYPWWPAMVEMDPDTEAFLELESESSMLPSHYHVVFFDDKVSRAWMKTSNLQTFHADKNAVDVGSTKNHGYKKEINAARANALVALNMPLKDRIKKYSFATRYSKKNKSLSIKMKYNSGKSDIKRGKKRKIVDDECLPSPDLLDGEKVGEIFANAESVLENIEEILESMDSQDNQSHCSNNDKLHMTPQKKVKSNQNLGGQVATKKRKLTTKSTIHIEEKANCDTKEETFKNIDETVKKVNMVKPKFKKVQQAKDVTLISNDGSLNKSTTKKDNKKIGNKSLLKKTSVDDILHDDSLKNKNNNSSTSDACLVDKDSESNSVVKGLHNEHESVKTGQNTIKKKIKPDIIGKKEKKVKGSKQNSNMEKKNLFKLTDKKDMPKNQLEATVSCSKSGEKKEKAVPKKCDEDMKKIATKKLPKIQTVPTFSNSISSKKEHGHDKCVLPSSFESVEEENPDKNNKKTISNKKFTGPKKKTVNKNEIGIESFSKHSPSHTELDDVKLSLKMEPASPEKLNAKLQQVTDTQILDMNKEKENNHDNLYDMDEDLELEINVQVHFDPASEDDSFLKVKTESTQDGYDSDPIDFEE